MPTRPRRPVSCASPGHVSVSEQDRLTHRRNRQRLSLRVGVVLAWLLVFTTLSTAAKTPPAKQKALDEWRSLSSVTSAPPRAFVKSDRIQVYFSTETGVEAFSAAWNRLRIPMPGYRVHSAVLRWNQRLSHVPEVDHGWREATVISGAEWRSLATNLLAELAPKEPGRAAYYQAFLVDGVFYRDAAGKAHFAPLHEQPKDVILERRYSADETLEVLARLVDAQLARLRPGGSVYLLMVPDTTRFTQPLLLDRQQHRCVWLAPAARFDNSDLRPTLAITADGLSALLLESHGLALLRNPVSSVARLLDLGVESLVRFIRLPLPKATRARQAAPQAQGMDLVEWEQWLDHYTGTRSEEGTMKLLIDGDRFFNRLQQAIAQATNHLYFDVYIFDRDDVAVGIANQLKERSAQLDVKVILDRIGSIGAGLSPPASPLPDDFVAPPSITTWLRMDSRVQVRPFLNPWFSSDHSKVLLIDGTHAFLGGMNLGREYRYEWHDLMVELEGPIVTAFEQGFRRDWAHAGWWGDLGYAAALLSSTSDLPAATNSSPSMKLRRLPTKTAWKPFAAAVLESLRRARKQVYLENPYLFDKRVILNLVAARKRGVDVRVVLPRVNDFKAGGRGNLVIANYLLQHGVRVFFYPGMTHVKALLVDDWACVGSGNLNHLSLRVNMEQNVATSDPGFVAELKRDLFDEDFDRSYELTEPLSVEWLDFVADLLLEGL